MFELTGKVALITGATGGIGMSIAKKMKLSGAKLILSGTKQNVLSDLASELGDDIKKILIIGHNPTLHTLTEMLTNEHINRFTTCNLAKISFEGKWKTLAPSKCSLISIIKPKEMIN